MGEQKLDCGEWLSWENRQLFWAMFGPHGECCPRCGEYVAVEDAKKHYCFKKYSYALKGWREAVNNIDALGWGEFVTNLTPEPEQHEARFVRRKPACVCDASREFKTEHYDLPMVYIDGKLEERAPTPCDKIEQYLNRDTRSELREEPSDALDNMVASPWGALRTNWPNSTTFTVDDLEGYPLTAFEKKLIVHFHSDGLHRKDIIRKLRDGRKRLTEEQIRGRLEYGRERVKAKGLPIIPEPADGEPIGPADPWLDCFIRDMKWTEGQATKTTSDDDVDIWETTPTTRQDNPIAIDHLMRISKNKHNLP